MKRIFLMLIVPFFLISCEKEEIYPISDIPSEISDYISTYFPGSPVIQAIKDTDGLELTYDITLEGGFLLEFNRKKEVIEIEGLSKLPDSVIPANILDYVTTHYPDKFVIGWELDDKHQTIKLDNHLELEFNMEGVFLRIDN